jgi:hypothetical protein
MRSRIDSFSCCWDCIGRGLVYRPGPANLEATGEGERMAYNREVSTDLDTPDAGRAFAPP